MHVKHLLNRLRLVFLKLINHFFKAGTQQNKDICVHIKRRKVKRNLLQNTELEIGAFNVNLLVQNISNYDVFSSIIHEKEGSYLAFSTWLGAQHDSQQLALSVITLVISGQMLVNWI